jgi:tRNA 2-selenouridine synthase
MANQSEVHPFQLEVYEFESYSLVIDARSPREYAVDHIPGAVNLPVVSDEEFALVGTRHRTSPHEAYLIGVECSLRNIAAQLQLFGSRFGADDHFLVYCFRGGKRSRLWADNLRTIGFKVDVLPGGWKNYRRWVISGLELLPRSFSYRVLSGPTGSGKTRLLKALASQGEQVLDLEGLAMHRGSLIGEVPNLPQPSQKAFESALLDALRKFDSLRPVWIEAESKKIGKLQLPDALYEAMRSAPTVEVEATLDERVALWKEDYANLANDPVFMVRMLEPLKPLVGKEELTLWEDLAKGGQVTELFERVMQKHYDPCYERSNKKQYKRSSEALKLALPSLSQAALGRAAIDLRHMFSEGTSIEPSTLFVPPEGDTSGATQD